MEIDEGAPIAQAFDTLKRNNKLARNKEQPLPNPKSLLRRFLFLNSTILAVDTISRLCGYAETLDVSEAETRRLSNSINLLRHWRDFNYKPRTVRFARQHNSEKKDVIGEVTLPQFSAAVIPQKEIRNVSEVGVEVEPIKDFVMHVGGAVWALDWRSGVDRNPENSIKSEDVPSQVKKKTPGKPKDLTLVQRPRGRPRKKPLLGDTVEKIDSDNQHQGEPPLVDPLTLESFSLDSTRPDNNITSISSSVDPIPVDVALPRMVMCLAHNGKVVWDIKWRPASACFSESRNIMGLSCCITWKWWEAPLPRAVKHVYPTSQKHIDPCPIKLQSVFRSSVLKCGDRQSIPLTVEWSVSSPHDMISAGCHDGIVGIWKFSVSDSLTECRPLVYINADTGPIRALAWAPIQSNHEGANIIITAGSKGFKFWDICDPFCPLWVNPFLGTTFGLDWLPDPRCVYGAMEDGTMWLLSLERAAHDIPLTVTGNYHNVASKHGFHSFHCSTFASFKVRLTGFFFTIFLFFFRLQVFETQVHLM
ncbi:hypothetical protein SASPL_140543 [Salvia splendens]|uniref:General transcription factor 3C polypeptide 2 n=1 Tax=Salvia splendens TaxID=180675 RepID=A0A8X8WS43_SALSN|nr:hypothetical protein SASPL_140543 [Salvia splendens]